MAGDCDDCIIYATAPHKDVATDWFTLSKGAR
jgi:hypothetical protein